MPYALICHPDFAAAAVREISAEVSRGKAGNLHVLYRLSGDPKRLTPSPWMTSARQRADALWQHSCFEAFLKPAGSEAYWEFNTAPTHAWQAYRLSGYRHDLRAEEKIARPSIETRLMQNGLELAVQWPLHGIVPEDVPWRLGLAAVIDDGTVSYWALQHAPDQPDFHHPSNFALELAVTP